LYYRTVWSVWSNDRCIFNNQYLLTYNSAIDEYICLAYRNYGDTSWRKTKHIIFRSLDPIKEGYEIIFSRVTDLEMRDFFNSWRDQEDLASFMNSLSLTSLNEKEISRLRYFYSLGPYMNRLSEIWEE